MEYYITTAKTLCEEIEQLHHNEKDINVLAGKAAKEIKKALTSFRNKIRKDPFKSIEEEIHFFKFIKPKIHAYLLFYSVLQEIESSKFHMSDEEIKNLIDKKMRMFRHIMRENIDFVKYYTSGMDHFDKLYFVRDTNLSIISRHTASMLVDPEFNTSHDLVAADIIAFDLLKRHFATKELSPAKQIPVQKLKWTASKLDLVELIYALHSSGAINHGDADLKEIQEALEMVFKIKIDDLYRSFLDIVNRKKEQLKFIPKLEEGILKKVNEIDHLS